MLSASEGEMNCAGEVTSPGGRTGSNQSIHLILSCFQPCHQPHLHSNGEMSESPPRIRILEAEEAFELI